MAKKRTAVVRLSIYLHDPAIRRQVKMNAVRQDLSVSEYCLRAISAQLIKDGKSPPGGEQGRLLEAAVEKARRFQAGKFRGRVFSVSSADLIREAREARNAR